MDRNPKKDVKKSKRTSRQIVALGGVILLVLLYIATLIAAIADRSASAFWFRLCLIGTLFIPVVIWLYSWMYGRLTGKPTIGDPETADIMESHSETAEDPTREH